MSGNGELDVLSELVCTADCSEAVRHLMVRRRLSAENATADLLAKAESFGIEPDEYARLIVIGLGLSARADR